jgi:hypothetical protein
MQAVLDRMNLHRRVILCGLLSGYNHDDPALASFGQVLIKRLRVEGFIILDYASTFMDAGKQLGMWKMMGKIKDKQTIIKGLEKAPEAINMLFQGSNIGKLILEFERRAAPRIVRFPAPYAGKARLLRFLLGFSWVGLVSVGTPDAGLAPGLLRFFASLLLHLLLLFPLRIGPLRHRLELRFLLRRQYFSYLVSCALPYHVHLSLGLFADSLHFVMRAVNDRIHLLALLLSQSHFLRHFRNALGSPLRLAQEGRTCSRRSIAPVREAIPEYASNPGSQQKHDRQPYPCFPP